MEKINQAESDALVRSPDIAELLHSVFGSETVVRDALLLPELCGQRVNTILRESSAALAHAMSEILERDVDVTLEDIGLHPKEVAEERFKDFAPFIVLILRYRRCPFLCLVPEELAHDIAAHYEPPREPLIGSLKDRELTVFSYFVGAVLANDEKFSSERVYFSGLEHCAGGTVMSGATAGKVLFRSCYGVCTFQLQWKNSRQQVLTILSSALLQSLVETARLCRLPVVNSSPLMEVKLPWSFELQLSVPILSHLSLLNTGSVIPLVEKFDAGQLRSKPRGVLRYGGTISTNALGPRHALGAAVLAESRPELLKVELE